MAGPTITSIELGKHEQPHGFRRGHVAGEGDEPLFQLRQWYGIGVKTSL